MLNVSGQEVEIDSKIIAIRELGDSCKVEFENISPVILLVFLRF